MPHRQYRLYRKQHPVGHGFFHTASITPYGDNRKLGPFHYIYDCGSHAHKALDREVAAYVADTGDYPIDLLVISHFHGDHINGIRKLFAAKKKVKMVVIPYMGENERLLLIASLLAQTERVADEVLQFAANPDQQLVSLGAQSVVTMSALPNEGGGQNDATLEVPEEWTLRRDRATGPVISTGGTIGHGTPVVATIGQEAVMEFLFFCWNGESKANDFAAKWAATSDISVADILNKDTLPLHIANEETVTKLRECYDFVTKEKLNWSSLCLLATPIIDPGSIRFIDFTKKATLGRHSAKYHSLMQGAHPRALAWLGTGDFEIAEQAEAIDQFFAHYGSYVPIHTLSIPHHGSIKNHNPRFLSHFGPTIAFITCPKQGVYHPDKGVERHIQATVPVYQRVDDHPTSAIVEELYFCNYRRYYLSDF